MRMGLDSPTEEVPAGLRERLRTYLDGQRAISLAVWVRHEHHGPEGTSYDHHTMLGVDDDRFRSDDMSTFGQGIDEDCPAPGWVDIFPRSEVEALCSIGEVLWRREGSPSDELDPLEFQSSWEPLAVPAEQRERFAAAVREAAPAVVRVEATRRRLRKGEAVVVDSIDLFVECGRPVADALSHVGRAARECGIVAGPRSSVTWGLPRKPSVRTAVVMSAGEEGS